MTCGHCVKAVNMALQNVNGVLALDVSIEESRAQVTYDDALTSLASLKSAIIEEGYSVEPAAEGKPEESAAQEQAAPEIVPQSVTSNFSIQGMSCVNCAQAIEKGLKKFPGILQATVNFPLERLTVEKDSSLSDEEVIKKVADMAMSQRL